MCPCRLGHSVPSNSWWLHGLYPARLFCPWNFPGKNTGVSCHFLLQAIFPTQGSSPGLLHCRQILYCLSQLQSDPEINGSNKIEICTLTVQGWQASSTPSSDLWFRWAGQFYHLMGIVINCIRELSLEGPAVQRGHILLLPTFHWKKLRAKLCGKLAGFDLTARMRTSFLVWEKCLAGWMVEWMIAI